jgi:hypothetical protein
MNNISEICIEESKNTQRNYEKALVHPICQETAESTISQINNASAINNHDSTAH